MSVGVWIDWFVSVVPVVVEEIFPFIKLDLCVFGSTEGLVEQTTRMPVECSVFFLIQLGAWALLWLNCSIVWQLFVAYLFGSVFLDPENRWM